MIIVRHTMIEDDDTLCGRQFDIIYSATVDANRHY
uniref:Uncharacterized protein n=1 Tax=Lepeophtheirus salmonis TaxID=72036 RepID=A0A0K2V9K7_LEPSM